MNSRKKNIPSDKFKQLVHYILWYCKQDNENYLNSIKLNKIIWLLDVWQYCREGHSMSGEEYYIKRKFGPVPLHILATLEELDTEGILQIKGYAKAGRIDIGKVEVAKPEKKDTEILSKKELCKVESFCEGLKSVTPQQLSDYSHDSVYRVYKEGEKIPLSAYLVCNQVKPTEEAIKWAKESIPHSKKATHSHSFH